MKKIEKPRRLLWMKHRTCSEVLQWYPTTATHLKAGNLYWRSKSAQILDISKKNCCIHIFTCYSNWKHNWIWLRTVVKQVCMMLRLYDWTQHLVVSEHNWIKSSWLAVPSRVVTWRTEHHSQPTEDNTVTGKRSRKGADMRKECSLARDFGSQMTDAWTIS